MTTRQFQLHLKQACKCSLIYLMHQHVKSDKCLAEKAIAAHDNLRRQIKIHLNAPVAQHYADPPHLAHLVIFSYIMSLSQQNSSY